MPASTPPEDTQPKAAAHAEQDEGEKLFSAHQNSPLCSTAQSASHNPSTTAFSPIAASSIVSSPSLDIATIRCVHSSPPVTPGPRAACRARATAASSTRMLIDLSPARSITRFIPATCDRGSPRTIPRMRVRDGRLPGGSSPAGPASGTRDDEAKEEAAPPVAAAAGAAAGRSSSVRAAAVIHAGMGAPAVRKESRAGMCVTTRALLRHLSGKKKVSRKKPAAPRTVAESLERESRAHSLPQRRAAPPAQGGTPEEVGGRHRRGDRSEQGACHRASDLTHGRGGATQPRRDDLLQEMRVSRHSEARGRSRS